MGLRFLAEQGVAYTTQTKSRAHFEAHPTLALTTAPTLAVATDPTWPLTLTLALAAASETQTRTLPSPLPLPSP